MVNERMRVAISGEMQSKELSREHVNDSPTYLKGKRHQSQVVLDPSKLYTPVLDRVNGVTGGGSSKIEISSETKDEGELKFSISLSSLISLNKRGRAIFAMILETRQHALRASRWTRCRSTSMSVAGMRHWITNMISSTGRWGSDMMVSRQRMYGACFDLSAGSGSAW